MAKESFITYESFTGINNIKNEWELTSKELLQAENVDINDVGRIVRKTGYEKKINGTFHSLYGDSYICLAVKDNNTLVRIHDDLTTVATLRSDIGRNPMSYARINDIVAYSNSNVIGYVRNGNSYLFGDPAETYKLPLPAGNLIEHFNNRLHIIIGKTIIWSDPLAYRMGYDSRETYKSMASEIMLYKAVDNGVFISDKNKIYFASGLDPKEWNQPGGLREVLDYPAKYNAWCEAEGFSLGGTALIGKTYAIATEKGICVISNGGFIKNITEDYYEMLKGQNVVMLFRERNNLNQVITAVTN